MEKLRCNKKLFAIVIATIFIAGCIGQSKINPYQFDYAGNTITFRANLNEAMKTPIEPTELDHQVLLLSPYVESIRIAFLPSDLYNRFYSVSGYELAYKLQIIMKANGGAIPITSLVLNKTDDAKRLATKENPIIVMQGSTNSTETVREGNLVYVRGKDMTEFKRDYTDLDLAADKLLLVLMQR